MQAEQMTIYQVLVDPNMWKGLFATSMGVIAHFLSAVKKVNGEVQSDAAKCYWTKNKRSSAISIVGAIVGFAYLYEQDTSSILAYLGVGYISDNIFNRAAGIANALTSPQIGVEHARAQWQEKHRGDGYGGGGYGSGGGYGGDYGGGGYGDDFGPGRYGEPRGGQYGEPQRGRYNDSIDEGKRYGDYGATNKYNGPEVKTNETRCPDGDSADSNDEKSSRVDDDNIRAP